MSEVLTVADIGDSDARPHKHYNNMGEENLTTYIMSLSCFGLVLNCKNLSRRHAHILSRDLMSVVSVCKRLT